MKLSGLLAATLTSVVALSSAYAADIYRAPEGVSYKDTPYVAVNWAGFYAGVNGGYAWSEHSDQLAYTKAPAFYGLSPEGGFGGGQIGFNWQGMWHPHLVLGIEADIQGAGVNASGSDAAGLKYKSDLDWFGTVRGRIGYAYDRALVYATGGFAYGGVQNTVLNSGALGGPAKFDDVATGYVLGGGIEYKFSPAWSVKAEYQYINLGKNDPVTASGKTFSSVPTTTLTDDAYHTVRAGLNYHFGDTYAPLK
jgi:outer membrane immunogenic protein